MNAPRLRHQDIQQTLEKTLGAHRKSPRTLFAYFGTGEAQRLTTKEGPVEVIPVGSELELRARLPPLGDPTKVVFLVPWTGKLPLDVGGRFHRSGTIQQIGASEQLKRLFDAGDVDDEARRSPLVPYLLRPDGPARMGKGMARLTHDAMWMEWLAQDWGWPVGGGLALDAVLGFVAFDARGPEKVASLAGDEAAGVYDALKRYLGERLGPAGGVALDAWGAGQGRELLELSLLFATLATADDGAARMWVKHQAQALAGVESDAAAAVAVKLGEAAPRALRWLGGRADGQVARAVLEGADRRLDEPELRARLVDDPRLPTGWTLRLERLGGLLEEAAASPSVEGVQALARARRDVEAHTLARDPDKLGVQLRAEMACRLAAWLAVTPPAWPEAAMSSWGDVDVLAPWYAQEGGFLDWARRAARGSTHDAFGRGAAAVVAAVDARRVGLDRRFARGLRAWNEADQPSHQVVPIHRAVKRIATAFLKKHDDRRLLVLLLDGMAWAQAVEILTDLGERSQVWGPLAWHQGEGRIGEGGYPAVLASLPTITKVSRSAFFAGKEMTPGKKVSSDGDRERWAQNADALAFCDEGQPPRLLLRGESHTGDGSASTEALHLVADTSQRMVAIVINAIDASLKGDAQHRHPWKVASIASLDDLLRTAQEAGRSVLLCSDHGHVPADCVTVRTGSKEVGGGRWHATAEADPTLTDRELAFGGSHVWRPPGGYEAAALLVDDTARYGGGSPAGDHGGATLAEVVAPCLLIGCDDQLVDDEARTARPLAAPRWWHLDVVEPVKAVAVAPPPPKPVKPSPQLSLLEPEAPEPEAPEPEAAPPVAQRLPALAQSKLFRERIKPSALGADEVLTAVDYLRSRGGVAPADAFATALAQHRTRVPGFVSKLGSVLNVDGYQVLYFDYAAQQVRLDRAKLEQLFEISL